MNNETRRQTLWVSSTQEYRTDSSPPVARVGVWRLSLFRRCDVASVLASPLHERIISRLEAVERGDISRLMIFLPPRHGKSLLASTHFPGLVPWTTSRPHMIFASYGQELSDDFGRQVRNLVADPLHQAIFSDCSLSEDSTAAHRFTTTRRRGILRGWQRRPRHWPWSTPVDYR